MLRSQDKYTFLYALRARLIVLKVNSPGDENIIQKVMFKFIITVHDLDSKWF